MKRSASIAATIAMTICAVPVLADGLGGGRPLNATSADGCIPPDQLNLIEARIAKNRKKLALPAWNGISSAPPQLLPFYPLAGVIDGDVYHLNFIDLDPASPGILDFACTPFTYDGHNGIDTPLRSFGEQAIGVPVFAALDGVVIDAHDGEFDMVTQPSGQPANYVIIDHGYALDGWYFHLKNGSVAVSVGDFVKAGQQIGLAASSGNSSGPHLHFTTIRNALAREPFAGACRPGPSDWVNQNPGTTSLVFSDFGITNVDLSTVQPLPFQLPAHGQVALADPQVYIWIIMLNLPVNSNWRYVFIRPNNSVEYDSGNFPFSNPDIYRGAWFWWGWNITGMHSITGTWHIDVYINNQLMVHAPIDVVQTVNPNFNRPPENITLSFSPVAPIAGDVLSCRVNASNTLDDLDFDIVRHHYVWKVNGGTVRDVTTAARSDVIPRDTAKAGDSIQCTVTPNDGTVNGNAAVISVVLGAPSNCVADIAPPGGNHMVNVDDLLKVINSWGMCP